MGLSVNILGNGNKSDLTRRANDLLCGPGFAQHEFNKLGWEMISEGQFPLLRSVISNVRSFETTDESKPKFSLSAFYHDVTARAVRQSPDHGTKIHDHLRAAGIFVNHQDAKGRTPLSFAYASQSQNSDAVIDSLNAAGANPAIADNDGNTPAHYIENEANFRHALTLAQRGGPRAPDLTAENSDGEPPLHTILLRSTQKEQFLNQYGEEVSWECLGNPSDMAAIVSHAATAGLDLDKADGQDLTIFQKLEEITYDHDTHQCQALVALMRAEARTDYTERQKIDFIFKHGEASDFKALGIDLSKSIATEDLYTYAITKTQTTYLGDNINPLKVAHALGGDILAETDGRRPIALAQELGCSDGIISYLQSQKRAAIQSEIHRKAAERANPGPRDHLEALAMSGGPVAGTHKSRGGEDRA